MEVHYKVCTNTLPAGGEFVTCEVCDVRFKTYQIKERHIAKTHKVADEESQNEDSQPKPYCNLFLEPERILPETAEELRDRILSESRKLSINVRPPGRPPRTMPRPPIVLRADPVDHEATRVMSRSKPSLSEALKDDDQMRARERELAMEEAKLKEYQERVLRYERLAEEATKVALKDKELRLKKLADDLREREMQAKKKLKCAVESINVGKSEPQDQDQTLARIMSFERQSNDDVESEADTELQSTSDINAPQVDPKHSILPEPEEKDLIEDEIIAAEPTPPPQPKLPQVIASHSAFSNQDGQSGAGLVVNNNANLESLISRASRGEVTLVAQASADGTYILVENTQEAINEAIQADQEAITDEIVAEPPEQGLEQNPKVQEVEKSKEKQLEDDAACGVPIKVQDKEPEVIVQEPTDDTIDEGMDQDPNETDQSDNQVEQTPKASPKRKREEDQESEPEAKKSKSSPNEEEDFQPGITSTVVKKVQIRYEQPEAIISSPVRTRKTSSKSSKKKSQKNDQDQDVFDELAKELATKELEQFKGPSTEPEAATAKKGRKAKVIPNPALATSSGPRRRTRQSLPELEPGSPKTIQEEEPPKEPSEEIKVKRGRRSQKVKETLDDKVVNQEELVQDEEPNNLGQVEEPPKEPSEEIKVKRGRRSQKVQETQDDKGANQAELVREEEPKNLKQVEEPIEDKSCEEIRTEPIVKRGRRSQKVKETLDDNQSEKINETPEVEQKVMRGRKAKNQSTLEEEPPAQTDQVEPIKNVRKGRRSKKALEEEQDEDESEVLKVQIKRRGRGRKPLPPLKPIEDEDKPLKPQNINDEQSKSPDRAYTQKWFELEQVLKKNKSVKCPKCGVKEFTTFPGLKYHLKTCGKSQEELDSLLIQCQYCKYRGTEYNYKMHYRNCKSRLRLERTKQVEDSDDEVEEESLTATGRKRRSAASKATKRLSNFISDEVDPLAVLEDSDDDFAKQLKTHQESEDDDDDDEGDAESSIASNQEDDDDGEEVISGPIRTPKKRYKDRYSYGGTRSEFDTTILREEKNFRLKNYFFNYFKDFNIVEWTPFEKNHLGFQRPDAKSVQFKIGNNGQVDTFEAFDTRKDGNDKYSFYTGGPIRASDWCPAPVNGLDVLALGVDDDFDTPAKSFVQLWTFGSNHKPQFKLMLDVGQARIHCLKWCPSLRFDGDDDQRLGLLAVATSLGTVQVLAVDKTLLYTAALANTTKYYHAIPSKILKRQDQANHCLRLSWYRGKDHRVLAGAFMVSKQKKFVKSKEF